jgi:aspartyl protease family protein
MISGVDMPVLSHDLLLYAGIAVAALVAVSLITRWVPLLGTLLRIACWGVIAVLLIGAIQQRSLFDPYFARLTRFLNLEPADAQQVSGKELRIPMSRDGHFWVRARINGVERKLLVDSGATITALSVDTAEAAGLTPEKSPFPIILKTANGAVAARTSRVATLRIGNVVARDLPVVVSPSFGDTEVIGMNFLSKLKSWRVEGNTLILEPHHPQAAAQRSDAA